MFKSKKRPIVIPQHEHGRMAGMLASIWGNESFEKPTLDFQAFVKGVTLHDWGYGLIDNLPIGEVPEDEWLAVTYKGLINRFEHPVTDVIVKLHLRRLLGFKESMQRTEMIQKLDDIIAVRLPESKHTMDDFMWADRITNLCDFIAFYFAFEKPFEKTFEVYGQRGSTEISTIHVEINSEGDITIDPWPFSLERFQGFIFGYAEKKYPEVLDPVLLPYRIIQG